MISINKHMLAAAVAAFALGVIPPALAAPVAAAPRVTFAGVNVGNGITLHYAEEGTGTPIVFVHGSLSDYRYWKDQVDAFSKHYRAIAVSRRYNWPNANPAQSGYSAITDADDLAAFIEKMHLGRVDVVGHSYGALAALFLAIRHPRLVRTLVLAEPPAVSLLRDLPPPQTQRGRAILADIDRRMVAPMKRDFGKGNTTSGVADFIDYVFNDPRAWQKFSPSDRRATLVDAREWQVMMTSGHLFPYLSPAEVRTIAAPTLIMSGAKSYPFLGLIDAELARLIPKSRNLVIPGVGHQMWYQKPEFCRAAVEAFLSRNG